MTSSGAAVSEQENSPRKMRSPQSLAASFAAVSGVSSWLTPTKTSRPGSPMAATTRWPMVTLAWLTRCTTARTFRRLLLLTSPGAVRPAIDAPGTPGGTAVKYLLMIYGNQEKWESMPPDAWPEAIARQEAFNAKYRATGELLGSYGLADAARAKLIRAGGIGEAVRAEQFAGRAELRVERLLPGDRLRPGIRGHRLPLLLVAVDHQQVLHRY